MSGDGFVQHRAPKYFKTGDRVKCIYSSGGGAIQQGNIYIVRASSTEGNVYVDEPGNPRELPGYYPGRFEHEHEHEHEKDQPIQPPQEFKVGDKVEAIKLDGGLTLGEKYTIRTARRGAVHHKYRWLYTLTNSTGSEHHYGGLYYGHSFKLSEQPSEQLAFSGTDHHLRGTRLKCIDTANSPFKKETVYYYRGPGGEYNGLISETPTGAIVKCPHVSSGAWGMSRFRAWKTLITEPKPDDKAKSVTKNSGPVQRTAPKRKAGALPRQKLLLL